MTTEDSLTHYIEATARMRERAEKAEQELAKVQENNAILNILVRAREKLFEYQRSVDRKHRQRIIELEEVQDHLIDAALIRHSSSEGPMFVSCAECSWILINDTNIQFKNIGHNPTCSIKDLLTTDRAQAKFDAWKPNE